MKKLDFVKKGIVIVALLSLGLWYFLSQKHPISPVKAPQNAQVLKPQPGTWEGDVWDFVHQGTFNLAQGGQLNQENIQRADFILINFWGSYCPPCREEMPFLDSLYSMSKGHMIVLGLSSEKNETIQKFVQSHNIHFPIPLLKAEELQRKAFEQVDAIPLSIIFDRQGRQIALIDGEWTDQDWKKVSTLIKNDLPNLEKK